MHVTQWNAGLALDATSFSVVWLLLCCSLIFHSGIIMSIKWASQVRLTITVVLAITIVSADLWPDLEG
jgi:hypothetical protein